MDWTNMGWGCRCGGLRGGRWWDRLGERRGMGRAGRAGWTREVEVCRLLEGFLAILVRGSGNISKQTHLLK